ncbi:hypothetical protein M427DRAFT_391008 [Gonapodya prolifera JEL478]|uniref:F-box domain-containing protein n=1 Tax=Gonapodya prolifera (strain JEL478) TaxID=1344416 RepID=A0A139A7D1_GONPJ|nr:hypothetical protein M427DRAFT_391008 [Gonapodya prolifera JEL478]|eukprot:KXS12706.1 hypothetical protein M427DRAFT_391008 [Gonapodya prolifera JEL478]
MHVRLASLLPRMTSHSRPVSPRSSSSRNALPAEILGTIFLPVPPLDLILRASLVSHAWRATCVAVLADAAWSWPVPHVLVHALVLDHVFYCSHCECVDIDITNDNWQLREMDLVGPHAVPLSTVSRIVAQQLAKKAARLGSHITEDSDSAEVAFQNAVLSLRALLGTFRLASKVWGLSSASRSASASASVKVDHMAMYPRGFYPDWAIVREEEEDISAEDPLDPSTVEEDFESRSWRVKGGRVRRLKIRRHERIFECRKYKRPK